MVCRTGDREASCRWRRRSLLAGVGALAVAMVAWGRDAWRVHPRASVPVADTFGPGTALSRWTIVAIHRDHYGALAIVMQTAAGDRFQVDVLARDDHGPRGVAQTERLSLYLSNRGDGDTATDEEQGLGALVLARALQPHETHHDLSRLLTLSQRNARFPAGAFAVSIT